MQVVDDHTVRFLTDGPAPLLPSNLSNIFILSSAQGVRSTAEFNTGRAAIGTGPFRFSAWQPGQPLVLEKNADYFGGAPHWLRVTFRPITNDGARVAALLSSDVDFINGVPLQDVVRLQREGGRTRVFGGPSANVYMLFPELGKDPLPGVRDTQGNPLPRNPWQDARVGETSDAEFARLHAINLQAGFALGREAARPMGEGGRIVFISSVNQWMPNPGLVAYGSAKAGLGGLARQMALELAPRGITANAVAPGTIETDFNRAAREDPAWRARQLALIPAGRTGTAEDVAGAILFLCSDWAGYVTGTTITVDGGLSLMGLAA